MGALIRDYTIERGIPFIREVSILTGTTPLDLTGATIEAFIRESKYPTEVSNRPTGTGDKITSFDTAIVGPGTDGKFTFELTIEKSLLLKRGVYDYDIVITFADTSKRRVLMGLLTAVEVTTRE
jgi:hypothetical protein